MKSPITGKDMQLRSEDRTLSYRREEFSVQFHFYLCEDTGEQFTTTELDEVNINQLYNQYRKKYNLPFPDEIKLVREQYGLSAAKMSEALGFGVNVYRNYEGGEVPNESNGKLIRLASNPNQFRSLVELSTTLPVQMKERLLKRIDDLVREQQASCFDRFLLGSPFPDEYTGYRKPNLSKFVEMVVFFAERLQPWKTKLNKLLFYADFSAFRQSCFSISGVRYRAIELGPVPNGYDALFEYMESNGDICILTKLFPDGGTGEQFKPDSRRVFNGEVFTPPELQILDAVVGRFHASSTADIVNVSHEEEAWKENHDKGRQLISYNYGFKLKAM